MSDQLLRTLGEIVGPSNVVIDDDVVAGYATDWTGAYSGRPRCVVRPADEAEVAAVVTACAAAQQPIVTQGGNTGLVGGSIAHHGEVLLSTRRLHHLGEVDVGALQVTAGAGVTIEALHHHAHAAGVDFGVDWGARGSATVGGAIATNAGGSRVVRFGTMRSNVVGVRAVMADGSIIGTLDGLPKETVGPHLGSVLCGSEGTLAVVTAARLRLVPWFRTSLAAWVGVRDLDHAVTLLASLRAVDGVDAVEVLQARAVGLTADYLGVAVPLFDGAGTYVLVDVARGAAADQDIIAADLANALEPCAPVGIAVASAALRQRLMHLRDHVTVAIAAHGVPVKLDVAVPVSALAELGRLVDRVVAAEPGTVDTVVFGHLAEGNLHVNLLGVDQDRRFAVAEAILDGALALGGTISAEHGVGVAKRTWLDRRRGVAEAEAWRSLKRAWDPDGLLNPGVLW